MGALGDWVVLNETTDTTKRYYLRFDRTNWTEKGELTERWWTPEITEFPAGGFAEDARAFFLEDHPEGTGMPRPYTGATPLAIWRPDAVTRFVFDGEIPRWIREYIDRR